MGNIQTGYPHAEITISMQADSAYGIASLAREFSVNEKELSRYITEQKIPVKKNGDISRKHLQSVLAFIEEQDHRIDDSLSAEASAIEFNSGEIRLLQDDVLLFLRKLPTGSVDVIVTDPAYSGMNNKLNLGHGRIVGQYANKGASDGKWFSEFMDTEENYSAFLSECKRVLKQSTGHLYIMFDSFSLLSLGPVVRKYFDVKNLITWDKVNIGMGHYFRRRHEYILFATNGNNRKIRNQCFPDVWRFKRIHRAAYPTQKPVELFQAMIYASAKKDFVVCDPFMGSASAAIAAIRNGCRFIGCDISPKAIEIASKRITTYLESGEDILQPKSMAGEEKVFWK